MAEQAILDKVVLEKVFFTIPTTVRSWLLCNGPTSLDQAASYLQNYFIAKQTMV